MSGNLANLHELLIELFSPREFRQWLLLYYRAELKGHLPGEGATTSDLIHAAIDRLEHLRGDLPADFFIHLAYVRPDDAETIGLHAAAFQVSPDELEPPRPDYESADAQQVGSALSDAYRRRAIADIADASKSLLLRIDREILGLKRRQRETRRLSPGEYLKDRYVLLKVLGHGGFAEVWLAWDFRGGEHVAVKVLHSQWQRDRTKVERFFRGAQKMSELRHPGVVEVLRPSEEDDGHPFFVMEYVPGGDLRQAVLENRIGSRDFLPVVSRVGGALQHAHDAGLVHRDVKPENLLLDADGQACLTDFDLVRALEETGATRTGGMGTFFYSAPECLMDASLAEPRSDLYSLAMTALFLLHGALLPPKAALQGAPAFARDLAGRFSLPVARELERALSWEPEHRHDSVAAFVQALVHATEVAAAQPRRQPEAARNVTMFRKNLPRPVTMRPEPMARTTTVAPWETIFHGPAEPQVRRERSHTEVTRIGRYEIVALLGEGGMGRVHRVVDTTTDQVYAMKILEADPGDERYTRFEREARIQQALGGHPGVMPIHDIVPFEGGLAFVMPVFEGATLVDWAREMRPSVDTCITVFQDVLSAVGHLHQAGVIHRDLKPHNILIDWNTTRPVLIDFGIAKNLGAQTITATGSTMGTPTFMAPEQIDGSGGVDQRADIFSLGCILYWLLCGRSPFDGLSIQVVLYAVTHGEYPPVDEFRSGVPEWVTDTIDRCLTTDPTQRFASVEELSAVLAAGG